MEQSIVISERGPGESWLFNINQFNSEDDIEITPETGKAILGLIAKAKEPQKFPGRFCCLWDCELEARFNIIGESNHPDDETDSCEEHVGVMLGSPDWLETDNIAWTVVDIPETELTRHRNLLKEA